MTEPPVGRDGIACTVRGCEGVIQASVPLWLSLSADGHWWVNGVGDEAAEIACDQAEHQNSTMVLHKSLTAFLDELFPARTWPS
jgi:hypothetical protein